MLLNQVVIAVFEIFGNKCSFLDHFRVFSSITNVFFELVNARELVGKHFFSTRFFHSRDKKQIRTGQYYNSCRFDHIRHHLRTHRNAETVGQCPNAATVSAMLLSAFPGFLYVLRKYVKSTYKTKSFLLASYTNKILRIT